MCQEEQNEINPAAIHKISDFSNVSDTILELLSKYEATEVITSPSKTSTPDLIESEIFKTST
jgi:hypothetical protein